MERVYIIIAVFILIISRANGQADLSLKGQVGKKDSIATGISVLVKNEMPSTEDGKNVYEIIPLYTSIIQTVLWILLILLIYVLARRRINEVLSALIARIRQGSSVQAGPFSVGEVPELITSTKEWADAEAQEKIYGNPDNFKTLFKIISPNLKKSTKAMEVDGGCIIQVSTERLSLNGSWAVAESITFVPGVKIVKDDPESFRNLDINTDPGNHLEKI